jgi:hypothetical protein
MRTTGATSRERRNSLALLVAFVGLLFMGCGSSPRIEHPDASVDGPREDRFRPDRSNDARPSDGGSDAIQVDGPAVDAQGAAHGFQKSATPR